MMEEENGRTVAGVVAEIKDEIKDFLQTRVRMLIAELHENISNSKTAAVYALLALTLLGTGYLLLTIAVVGLVAVAFWGNPYAWFFAFLIVGLSWSIFGVIFAIAAKNDFQGLTPKRTLQVLKEDTTWLRKEAQHVVTGHHAAPFTR